MGYELGVDLGTTYTAAAVHRNGSVQIVELGNRMASIPSVIYLTEDDTILTGEAANRRALSNPGRVAREFKRRIGDPTPILVGGSPYSAESLSARLLAWVIAQVSANEGSEPDRVAVTHPANWGPYKLDLLHQAFRMADLDRVITLSEPEAAAIHYSTLERIDPGMTVAVFDLGGGTFDSAVLRKKAHGFDLLGQPEGIERLGGIDFDAAVFAFVRDTLGGAIDELDAGDPSVASAVARLRRDCVEAKEALSSDAEVTVPVVLPGLHTDIRLTRVELERMIRPSLADAIGAMHRAIRSADLTIEAIDLILLVGGSSRIPLIGLMVGGELGRPIATDAHPKHTIPLGAAWAAADAGGGAGAHMASVTTAAAVNPIAVLPADPTPPDPTPVAAPSPGAAAATPAADAWASPSAPTSGSYQSPVRQPDSPTPGTAPASPPDPPPAIQTGPTVAPQAAVTGSFPAPGGTDLGDPPPGVGGGSLPPSTDSGRTDSLAIAASVGAAGIVDQSSSTAGSPGASELVSGSVGRGGNEGSTAGSGGRSSRTPLLVGIAAVALLAVAGLIALTQLGGDGTGEGISGVAGGAVGSDSTDADADADADSDSDDGDGTSDETVAGAATTADPNTTERTATTASFDCEGLCAHITDVEVLANGELVIDWDAVKFNPLETGNHAHFYWNIYDAEQVGTNNATFGAVRGDWQLTDEQPFSTAESKVAVANKPAGATALCVVAANSGHGVIDPGNADCFDLP